MHESWVPSTSSFGARLALIRWRMGWNMKEAALACGFSQQSWRGWELSGRDPRGFLDVARRISERTGVDEYWILTGKEIAPHPNGPDGGNSAPKDRTSNPKVDLSAGVISLFPHLATPVEVPERLAA